MSGEKVDFSEAAKAAADDNSDPGRKNERSAIAFPYVDLDGAIEVAKAIYARSGLSPCEIDELAAEMGQTLSGAFRLKTSAAKTFGLVDKDGRSAFKLTSLGEEAVEAGTEKGARTRAFLEVPLYSAVFEAYRGKTLPPTRALEREMERMGVSSKQTDKARQIFERSARQAGFFESGEDRLVRPRLEASGSTTPPHKEKPVEETNNGERSGHRNGGAGGGDGGKMSDKALEYKLVDLMKDDEVGDEERAAIWILIQFLTKRAKKNGGS